MSAIVTLDLRFYQTSELISSFLAPVDDGFVLFDPGPASTVEVLERAVNEAGFDLSKLRAIFPTHVHLDHSGGAGVLARRTGCDVYVHPSGLRHLSAPQEKLLPSAERLYGEMMIPLWGVVEAVPKEQISTVDDGVVIEVGGLEIVAHHTPGHAAHHVAWQVGGDLVTGDIAGVRFPGSTHVLPPMPPPDIDVEEWLMSLELVRGLEPERLLLTHFGAFDDPSRHLDELDARIRSWTGIAREVVADGGGTAELGARLLDLDEREISELDLPEDVVARYRRLCPMEGNSAGLFRYCSLDKRSNV